MTTPTPRDLARNTPAAPTTPKPTRRGRRKPRADTRVCCRDGCERPREPSSGGRYQYCGALCRVADRELRRAERVCEAVGPSPATAELWASVVELSDVMSRYLASDSELHEAARSVGIDDKSWQSIKDGRA